MLNNKQKKKYNVSLDKLKKKIWLKKVNRLFKKHTTLSNNFFKIVLKKYIWFSTLGEVLKIINNNTSVSNSLLNLYIKKLKFIHMFNTYITLHIKSYIEPTNLPFFALNGKNLLLKHQLYRAEVYQKDCFFLTFISNYIKNSIKSNKYNLDNIVFFLFWKEYFIERGNFLIYISRLLEGLSILSIEGFEYLTPMYSYNKPFYKIYFLVNSVYSGNLIRSRYVSLEESFLKKKTYFDINEFSCNVTNRPTFIYDYYPFFIAFCRNYKRSHYFYYLTKVYFLWDIISIFWSTVLDCEWKVYGPYEQIVKKYKEDIPVLNTRILYKTR